MPDYNESGIFTGVLRMNIDLSWLRHHPKDLEVFNLEKQYGDLEIAKDVHLLDRVAVELEVTNTGRLMVGKGEIGRLWNCSDAVLNHSGAGSCHLMWNSVPKRTAAFLRTRRPLFILRNLRWILNLWFSRVSYLACP